MKYTHKGFLLIDALLTLAVVTSFVTATTLFLSALTSASSGNIAAQARITELASKLEALVRSSFSAGLFNSVVTSVHEMGGSVTATPDSHTFTLSMPVGDYFAESEFFTVKITHPTIPLQSCDPFVTADWQSLAIDPLRFPTVAAGGKVSSMQWRNNVLAVAFSEVGTATTSTVVLSRMPRTVSTPPQVYGQFDNAPSSRIGYSALAWISDTVLIAANAFGSSGHAVCAANASCAQLHTYSAQQGNRIGTLAFATSSPPFASRTGGATAGATAVAATDTLVAVGLERTEYGMEFNLVDARDVQNMVWLGGTRIGRSVNNIAILGTRAFVVTDDPARELVVIDISTPTSPVVVQTWDAPGSRNFGVPVFINAFGDTIIIGRSYVGNAPELYALSATTLEPVATVDIGTPAAPDGIRAITMQDFLINVITQRSVQTFYFHNNAFHLKSKSLLEAGFEGTSLTCVGNKVVASVWSLLTGSAEFLSIGGL